MTTDVNAAYARLTLKQYAERIGVRYGTLKRWVFEGMPVLRDHKNHACGVYTNEADDWVRANHADSVALRRHEGTHVYFAKSDDTGNIKIGFTSDTTRRQTELRKAINGRAKILATLPGDKTTEQHLHKAFASAHVEGEWFAPTGELLAFVDTLRRAKAS